MRKQNYENGSFKIKNYGKPWKKVTFSKSLKLNFVDGRWFSKKENVEIDIIKKLI